MGAPNQIENDRDLRWAKMDQRLERIERLLAVHERTSTPAFAKALAYAPTILFLEHEDGRARRMQRRPKWWHDQEIRAAVVATHRQMTIDEALTSIRAEFGKDRAPSRSSLGRFWQILDEVRAAS